MQIGQVLLVLECTAPGIILILYTNVTTVHGKRVGGDEWASFLGAPHLVEFAWSLATVSFHARVVLLFGLRR